ncbi:hypothetical protein MTP99_006849 [Tenebrio molitor]|jgi:hypothetical protein|nr:hypothetical protein MTP99_006849 [Tenebrio molitor]
MGFHVGRRDPSQKSSRETDARMADLRLSRITRARSPLNRRTPPQLPRHEGKTFISGLPPRSETGRYQGGQLFVSSLSSFGLAFFPFCSRMTTRKVGAGWSLPGVDQLGPPQIAATAVRTVNTWAAVKNEDEG